MKSQHLRLSLSRSSLAPRLSPIKKFSCRPLRFAAEIAFRSSAALMALFALYGFAPHAMAAAKGARGVTLTLNGSKTGFNNISEPVNQTSASSQIIPLLLKSGAGIWELSGSNSFTTSFAAAAGDGIQITGGLIKTGAGVLTLAGVNTYNGPAAINGGELSVSNSSAINNSSEITFNGGALQDSSLNTRDYSAKFLSSLTAVAVDVNGQAITFASPIAASNTGGLSLEDSVASVSSLTLTASNAYTGQTAINTGATLILGAGGSLPNPNATVSGALVALSGNGGVTIGNASAAGILDIDINTATDTSDLLTVSGSPVATAGKGGLINLTDINTATAPATGTELTLIPDASGFGARRFAHAQPGFLLDGQNYSHSLANSTSTFQIITLTTIAANYYWTGVTSASWNTIGNFAQNPDGTTPWTGSLGVTSNVFLTANSVTHLPATLDGNYTINSLSFTGTGTAAASNPITLSSGTGTALTVGAAGAFGDQDNNSYGAGTGLVVQAGSAAHTINANIDLGNSQTWLVNNSSSNPLTLNGVIADGSTLDSLTKSGSGAMILNTPETYDGGTIVNNGTVALGTSNALLTTSTLTVTGSGTVDLRGNNQALAGLADGGASTGAITTSSGTATLTLINAANITFRGSINDNNASNGTTLALVLNGAGNVTLSGSSTYSGGTALNNGNLTVAGNYALGNPNATGANAGLVINTITGGTSNVFFTSSNPAIAALNNPGAGTSYVILGGTASGGAATTLNIGPGNNGASLYSGTISDVTATAAGGVGSLNVFGGATLTLEGANTYTGTTTVTGAGTQLILTNAQAIENSVYNTNGGGTLKIGSFTALSLGGLTGNNGFPLSNGANPLALTITGNSNSTFNGNLSGPGALTLTGAGTLVLNNATYTGNTLVENGGLTFSGSTNITTHLDISAQLGVATVVINGASVTSTNGLYITSYNPFTPAAYGNHANLTVECGAQLIAMPDATGRAISYGYGPTAGGSPSGTGVFTIGTAGDTTTLIDAQGAFDLFRTAGGQTVGNFTVDLNGGTLAVDKILKTLGAGNQTSTFYFNGGTLEALAADPAGSTFLPALGGLTADVQPGGAIINTNGFNITIAQPLLSGTSTDGGLTKNGTGILSLAGANTYVGPTTVNAGRLIVSGSAGGAIDATSGVTVNAGATIEDDGSVNPASTANVFGRLSGTGSIGAVHVFTSGTFAPGFSSTNTAAGTFTTHANVTLSGGATFSIRLGVAAQTDADQLIIANNGNVSLANATLALNNGAAFSSSNEPANSFYVLINGGGVNTGTGINVFANAPASGDSLTDSLGDTFDIFYAVNANNTSGGNDVVAQFVAAAIPEPSTWAEMIAGAGILCVAGRARRRSLNAGVGWKGSDLQA